MNNSLKTRGAQFELIGLSVRSDYTFFADAGAGLRLVQLLIVTRQIATLSAIHQFKFEFKLQVFIFNVEDFIEKISLYSKFEDP